MIHNESVICISSIDWDFVWQGHQEIMSAFAKNGNKVLFIENTGVRAPNFKDIPRLAKRIRQWLKSVKGFRKEADNLFVYSPLVVPFPYSRFARWINKHLLVKPLKCWMLAMGFHRPILWTFLPTGTALDIINSIDKKLLVYYYIADFDELTDNVKKLKSSEESVMSMCDIIFAQGSALAKKARQFNENVFIYPFGVNTDIFDDFLKTAQGGVPEDLMDIPRPIIGYVGGIHKHIDCDLLEHIAATHPDWSLVMVGPEQIPVTRFAQHSNVFFMGKRRFSDLPAYINNFDVCIIPYLVTEYTRTVYPTKLNEYHAMGKPVISTPLPEVMSFNEANEKLVAIATTKDDFVKSIAHAMTTNDSSLIEARMTSAGRNNWEARIGEMSARMERVMREEKDDIPANWQERFLGFYRHTRRRIAFFLAAALIVWAMVFYTPLVWFLAEPLKIAQQPQKADAIVVLAGGVGESGNAGQGYEERVEYAVKLYKEGYAPRIIFSSGYMYVFKEPLMMKALAVSLGVPERAIILEDKAKNTYENMLNTMEILQGRGWRKALFVSSPYNMRRVSLVGRKIDPAIEAICTPIPYSRFYSHPVSVFWIFNRQVSIRQLAALVHEYVALVYYKLKGYA